MELIFLLLLALIYWICSAIINSTRNFFERRANKALERKQLNELNSKISDVNNLLSEDLEDAKNKLHSVRKTRDATLVVLKNSNQERVNICPKCEYTLKVIKAKDDSDILKCTKCGYSIGFKIKINSISAITVKSKEEG